jgi:hypothetical protein
MNMKKVFWNSGLGFNKIVTWKSDIYDEEEYKKRKGEKIREDKKILGRSEWVYFLWYLHLKLCLEMEEKGIHLQLRNKYRSGVKEQRKVNRVCKLKINRKVYEGIDWEDLKTLSWRKWKKKYINIFMTGETKEVGHGDELKCEPQNLYLEMDLRNTETVLVNQLKKILRSLNRKNLPSSKGVMGKPNYHSSILGYNFIVGMIHGEDWEKIVGDNLYRMDGLMSGDNYEIIEEFLRNFMEGDYSFKGEFEGFCYSNLHRYVLDTQKVLYNVSQGRFFDKKDVPINKWKKSWSKNTFTW